MALLITDVTAAVREFEELEAYKIGSRKVRARPSTKIVVFAVL